MRRLLHDDDIGPLFWAVAGAAIVLVGLNLFILIFGGI